MKNWKPAAAAAACLFLIGMTVIFIKANYACDNVNKRAALKIFESNGCIEFWSYRYQAAWSQGIASIVAIFAASLAWIAVQKQIKSQQVATMIAEATFWQHKHDAAMGGVLATQAAEDNLRELQRAKARQTTGQNVNLAAIQDMKRGGQYPLLPVAAALIGPEAHAYVRFTNQLELAMRRVDEMPGHSTLIDIDRAIGQLLQELENASLGIASARSRLEGEIERSSAALARIKL